MYGERILGILGDIKLFKTESLVQKFRPLLQHFCW